MDRARPRRRRARSPIGFQIEQNYGLPSHLGFHRLLASIFCPGFGPCASSSSMNLASYFNMKRPVATLRLTFIFAFGTMAAVYSGFAQSNLTTQRTYHAATVLPSGQVLLTGGVDEQQNTLQTAELYNPATKTSTATGMMNSPRAHHTSTLLSNGTVLIAGGDTQGQELRSAEIYDPSTGKFSRTPQMQARHAAHTATTLENGDVLIVGGLVAEIFNPKRGQFVATGAPNQARINHAATLLSDGKVLITGGYTAKVAQDTAELYLPAAGQFVLLASKMTVPRALHAMTLLPSGNVIITGGFSETTQHNNIDSYDPVSETFTAAGVMLYYRASHRQVLVNGKVFIIGGTTLDAGILSTDEMYDPSSQTSVAAGSMTANRANHTASQLPPPSNSIYVAGGITGGLTLQTAEIIDPSSSSFSPVSSMTSPRALHTATLLTNGAVLVAGGSNSAVKEASAEVFDPNTDSFTAVGSMLEPRQAHTATALPNGLVLIAGGEANGMDLSEAELYNPANRAFSQTASMKDGRSYFNANLLPNGEVVVMGGRHGPNVELRTAELFNPSMDTFTGTVGELHKQRKRHTGTSLMNGDVLVAGGTVLGNNQGGLTGRTTKSAELYNHATERFAIVGKMHQPRSEAAAVLLNDGFVLVTGGINQDGPQDVYDPSTQTFAAVGHLLEPRARHQVILLNSTWGSLAGQALVIGGGLKGSGFASGIFQALTSVEIYNPASKSFIKFGDMNEARWGHTATELADGRILITGGTGAVTVSGTGEELTP